MKTRRVVALFAVFVVFCLIAPAQSLASQVRIVRLSHIDGEIQIERPGVERERAVLNMPVVEGTRVFAEDDAAVEVEFENGSTLRMVGPAVVWFRELSLREQGDMVTQVELQPGTYYFDVNRKGNEEFRVSAMNHDLRVQKSSRFRIVSDTEQAEVAVFKGELELDGRGQEVAIKKNETVMLDATDASRYYLAKGTDENPNDSWDSERDRYRESYANSRDWQYANLSYGDPYSYGFTDLAYYGNFFNVPGYGWMWRPAYFSPGWDPFDNGAWAYYPGQGWIFVSMYPWGWTPYRYGQWSWVPAHGWCWRPSRFGPWNAVPVVRNAPGGWHRPSPPPSSVWRTVVVNPKPNPNPNPAPGAWHRPNPPTGPAMGGGWRRAGDQRGDRPRVKQPTRDGIVVPRQPENPAPVRTLKTADDTNPRPNDARGGGNWRRADPEGPRREDNQGSPKPAPAPVSPQPRATPSPRVPPPVERSPEPRMSAPRSSPEPRVSVPRSSPPEPQMSTPRMSSPSPAPRMDTGSPRESVGTVRRGK